jgi:putative spermidine/putrescine transport system ATP-binding protein
MNAAAGHGASVRIETCGKTFADGTHALEPASLDIARGETLVLLGRPAAARPPCCALSQVSNRPTLAGRCCSTART